MPAENCIKTQLQKEKISAHTIIASTTVVKSDYKHVFIVNTLTDGVAFCSGKKMNRFCVQRSF